VGLRKIIPLDEKQIDVLMMVAEGYTNEQIAEEIDRNINTVKHILAAIRYKLEAKNMPHAVALAYHHGILLVKSPDRSEWPKVPR